MSTTRHLDALSHKRIPGIQEWLSALEAKGSRGKKSGDGKWLYQCPSHDDPTASLSLREAGDCKVLAHCFAGCSFKEIRDTLGLTPAARLPADPVRLPTGGDIERYDYHNADGSVAFYVFRFPGKKFQQWTPSSDPDRGYPKAPTSALPLFRLQEILTSSGEVTLHEGEKDVLNARQAWPDHVFTTWAGGAGFGRGALKWQKTDLTPLRGRPVNIVLDLDRAGRETTQALAKHLHDDLSCTVRYVLEPENAPKQGKDVSEWLGAGAEAAADRIRAMLRDYDTAEVGRGTEAEHRHRAKTAEPHNIPRARSAANIADMLDVLGYRFRHNVRERMNQVGSEDGWGDLDKMLLAFLSERIAETQTEHKAGVVIPMELSLKALSSAIDTILQRNKVDPFVEWLEGLDAWDGLHRLDGWLAQVFQVADDHADLLIWASRFIFMGPVARACSPGRALPQSPLLMGPTGIGKSLVLAQVVPPEHRDAWFTDDFDIALAGKNRIEKTLGAVVVEMGEMRGYTRADLSDAKSFLTRNTDKDRLAYGRTAVNIPRRFITVGTANQDYRLPWETALQRRLVPVFLEGKLEGEEIMGYMAESRGQLFAEALHEVRAGKSPLLEPKLLEQVFAEHEHIRMTDDAVENAVDDFLHNDGRSEFTLQELLLDAKAIDPSGPRSILPINEQHRWGRALRQRGYESYRTRRGDGSPPISLWRKGR